MVSRGASSGVLSSGAFIPSLPLFSIAVHRARVGSGPRVLVIFFRDGGG